MLSTAFGGVDGMDNQLGSLLPHVSSLPLSLSRARLPCWGTPRIITYHPNLTNNRPHSTHRPRQICLESKPNSFWWALSPWLRRVADGSHGVVVR